MPLLYKTTSGHHGRQVSRLHEWVSCPLVCQVLSSPSPDRADQTPIEHLILTSEDMKEGDDNGRGDGGGNSRVSRTCTC